LSKICEFKGEEVIGGRRKLHTEKLHDLYGGRNTDEEKCI